MTVCRKCGKPIERRAYGWGHSSNPRMDHHYAMPRRVAPESEAEKRLAYGDR